MGLNPCSPKEDEGSGERRKKRKMHKEEEREVRVGWLASAHDVLVFFVVSLFQLLDFFICIASALTNDYTTDDDL